MTSSYSNFRINSWWSSQNNSMIMILPSSYSMKRIGIGKYSQK
jgi:hypothetical protein